ncbi:MAG: DUF971 domain-containing protein [Pirellulales bacterium]|nr:DUF971 domain-containing protein [Pirellulales bacterium]
MSEQPTGLSLRDDQTLVIDWTDGRRRAYDITDLRRNCPCAACNSERARSGSEEAPLDLPGKVALQEMTPVGNYAYHIEFSDGHSTGIYPLDLLRSLGKEES